jgi:hypothetical protein
MKYTLVQKSVNKSLAKFYVQHEQGDIIGSINVPPEAAADLLRHWAGPKPAAAAAGVSAPVQRANAFIRLMGRMPRAMVLRGC